jgi:hypothetical protein
MSRFYQKTSLRQKAKLLSIVLFVWMCAFCYLTPEKRPDPANHPVMLWVTVLQWLSCAVWRFSVTLEKVGWPGIGCKACMLLNTFVVAFTLGKGRDPWTWFYYPYPKFTPHIFGAEVVLVVGSLVAIFMPARMLFWVMDPDTRISEVLVIKPCLGWLFCTVVLFGSILWDIDKAKQAHPGASAVSIIRQLRHLRKTSRLLNQTPPSFAAVANAGSKAGHIRLGPKF